MSEGPVPRPKYCSPRERALAETHIEWPKYEYKEVRPKFGALPQTLAAQGYAVEVHRFLDPDCPRYFTVYQSCSPLYTGRSHSYAAVAGVLAAGVGVGAASWIFRLPSAEPLSTMALVVFGACAVYLGILAHRWSRS